MGIWNARSNVINEMKSVIHAAVQGTSGARRIVRSSVRQSTEIINTPADCRTSPISAGLASFDEAIDRGSLEILKLADDRLLRAKAQGRNKVVYLGGG